MKEWLKKVSNFLFAWPDLESKKPVVIAEQPKPEKVEPPTVVEIKQEPKIQEPQKKTPTRKKSSKKQSTK